MNFDPFLTTKKNRIELISSSTSECASNKREILEKNKNLDNINENRTQSVRKIKEIEEDINLIIEDIK